MAVFLLNRVGLPFNMKNFIRFLLIPLILLSARPLSAQTANPAFKIQQERKLWHDNIDREQKRLLALDGKPDEIIQVSKDENINLQIADVMIRQVDHSPAANRIRFHLERTDEDQKSPFPRNHDQGIQ